jgi:predicted RNA-binding Zn-ribbon protein involved in translation (DUF1610 family)
MSAEFEDYFSSVENQISDCVGGRELYALKIAHKNYFRIKTGFYEDENPSEVADEICMMVTESSEKVKCPSCGWSWEKSTGGEDMYQCHKCGNTGGYLTESVITESSVFDLPVRQVVKDLLKFIKLEEEGSWYLPEEVNQTEMEYNFPKIPLFSVEFTIEFNDDLPKPYLVDGSKTDDDVIEIFLIINPEFYPKNLYDILADLNDLVAHELEHIMQDNYLRPEEEINPKDPETEAPKDKTYYLQAHEIPAELKGFRRIVKLRKQKPEQVIRDWFNRTREIHRLDDNDIDELVGVLTQKYEQYYGKK